MKRPVDQTEKSKSKPVEALDEESFIALYNLGRVIRLRSGQTLFRKGDRDGSVYLVLKGSLEAANAAERGEARGVVYRENDWIGEMTFFPRPTRTSSVSAVEPSTVLAFDDAAFAGIEPRVQLFALRRMNDLTVRHRDRLASECARASKIGRYYRSYIQDSSCERNKLYEKSDMLYAIIKSVPQLPVYTTRLIQMLLNDSASVREVTELAKEDPSLASEILKTINSSYYSLQRRVSDLQYAVMYMGFFQVYQIVVSDGMRKVMPDTPDFMGIHHHSVIISHLAFEICQLCDKRSSSVMSTISLLHDIGKSVIHLIKAKNPKLVFFVEMLDAPEVGAMLLKEWNIPESVYQTVRCQNYPVYQPPSELPQDYLKSIAFLYMAHVCHDYFQGETDTSLKHPFIDEYLRLLGVSGISIQDFIDRHVVNNLKLKMNTFPRHVQGFLSKKIELNRPG